MSVLPPPEFVRIDPAAIEAELVARYEQKSGKTLYPAQIERLFIDQVAYAETRLRLAIQHAGEQLLVRYSSGPILDYLADLVGVVRLLATAATCTLRFSLSSPAAQAVGIPAGTLVCSQDNKVQVATDELATIAAGQLSVEVAATCTAVGTAGNGWAVGQLNTLVAPLDGVAVQVSNTSATSGGADDESDANLADRICLAPESYSNAGSEGAYRFHVRSVHQSIIAVAVLGPDDGLEDGHVELYPLTGSGLPGIDLLDRVRTALSARDKRPLTDKVTVLAPVEVPYSIRATLDLYRSADPATTLASAQTAADAWAAARRAGLGLSIVPEQIQAVLQVAGVYRARLIEPEYRQLAHHEWANCVAIELEPGEMADG